MKSLRYLTLALFALLYHVGFTQATISPLRCNPKLYYHALQQHQVRPAYLPATRGLYGSLGTILIKADTLPLPFFDDFSTNTLRPTDFTPAFYDTLYRIFGPCDSAFSISTLTDTFYTSTTYTYSFNTTTRGTDSVATTPKWYYTYPPTADCFSTTLDSILLYPKYHRIAFDTSGKKVLDTILKPDTIIAYAPIIYKAKLPPYCRWMDNYAWVNRTLATYPPSIGVATLDGLNQYGLPYSKLTTLSQPADTLTSCPIDLSGLGTADSVYLSFFYEARGFGDIPNEDDSLILEIFNAATNGWDEIWTRTILDTTYLVPYDSSGFTHYHTIHYHFLDTFQQVLLLIPKDVIPTKLYYKKGFQFRFRNYASVSGNNDHWHIDYVRVDKGRTRTDTAINDLAFVYDYPSILKHYTEMPTWQYTGAADIIDTIPLVVSNLNTPQAINNPPSTTYFVNGAELYPTAGAVANYSSTFNAGPISTLPILPSVLYAVATTTMDTMAITSRAYITNPNPFTGNDTIRHTQLFGDILAYDDGSAERAIGVENNGLKKFAYRFDLHNTDTLVGYQIMYSNIDVNVQDLVFTFQLWDSLRINDPFFVDTPVFTSDNKKPYYIDSVNGFTTYRIDPTPLPLHFYLGWAQTDVRNLQVGFDVHSTRGTDKIFIYASGLWTTYTPPIAGSPMIRLLLRHTLLGPSGVNDIPAPHDGLTIYPNPTLDKLNIILPDAKASYQLTIINTLGQIIRAEHLIGNLIEVSDIAPGIYHLCLTDTNGRAYRAKFVKGKE